MKYIYNVCFQILQTWGHIMATIKNINDKMLNLSKPKFIFVILLLNPIISVMFITIKIFNETYVSSMREMDI